MHFLFLYKNFKNRIFIKQNNIEQEQSSLFNFPKTFVFTCF